MISVVRHLTLAFLVAIIAVTSTSMAVARGQMRDASGTMILCTGDGPMAIQVDSRGQPVEPMPLCPDCVFGLFDLATDAQNVVAFGQLHADAFFEIQFDRRAGAARLDAHARGPPTV